MPPFAWGWHHHRDPGDEDESDFPVCVACDRKHFQVNDDGLCVTCDSIVAAQARNGISTIETWYLPRVSQYREFCEQRGLEA